MYTEHSTGHLTIWWPRWRQFTEFLKWILPIVLHYMEWSVVDFITRNPVTYKSDFASVIFTASISFSLLYFCNILPEAYRPASMYWDTVVQVAVQITITDILMRTIGTALQYQLYYACSKGYVGNFIDRYLFFLYIFDGYIPVKKFVRISTTDEGFEQARVVLGFVQLVFGIVSSRFYLRLFGIYHKIQYYIAYILSPLVKGFQAFYKGSKRKGRSRSKRRGCYC